MTTEIKQSPLLRFFDSPKKWSQGAGYRDGSGFPVGRDDPASSFDLEAAINVVYRYIPDRRKLVKRMLTAIVQPMGFKTLTEFNDDPDTTFEEVLAVCRQANV